MRQFVQKIVFIVFLLGAFTFGITLIDYYRENAKGEKAYEEVKEKVVKADSSGKEQVCFLRLLDENEDSVGWIKACGGEINYPVVQGKDNEFYLNHNVYKESDRAGCIFVDASCSKPFYSFQTILYGHHMKNHSMFAKLEGYKEEAYWREHPVIVIETEDERIAYEVFATFTSAADQLSVLYRFENEKQKRTLLEQYKQRAFYDTGINVNPEDQILTLLTCDYEKADGRMVVVARRVK